MIHNVQELKIVRKQLSLVEDALAALRRAVLPKNKRNFAVLSEGYVDQITALKAEIRAYRTAGKKNGKGATRTSRGRTQKKI